MLPIEAVVAVFFILVALMFVGLGQVLGRAFDAYPNRVMGYTLNIVGSLTGIAGFTIVSFVHAPPVVWFVIGFAGIAYLLYKGNLLTRLRGLLLGAALVIVVVPDFHRESKGIETRWSPYYMISHDTGTGSISVNTIGHQQMVPFDKAGSSYSLIHLLQRRNGGKPFDDMLVIGAGSRNDIAHALRFGVKRIDAVEIDPMIQDIGALHHPDRPYQDQRVVRNLDDGRHFLRVTDRRYDLVVYALVDSLILHSSYSNLRLESFLFTEQAFADIKRVLKPGGVFVTYNFFRQGWIVERVAAMAEAVFGCKPVIFSLPHVETLNSSAPVGFAMVIASCSNGVADAFDGNSSFWLNVVPPANLGVDGFAVRPESMVPEQRSKWERIAQTTLLHDGEAPIFANDDWPFLYLRGKLIPELSIRSMVVLGALGVAMVLLFLPKGRVQIHGRMFFLGAGFMLLETKAVVQLALLFGSTWLVNSLVFATVLVLILLANVYVLKAAPERLHWHYVGLFVLLAAAALVPFDLFISGGLLWRYAMPCVLALGPMFFAGVIFARTFRDATNPDQAFGSNIAGAVIGGLCESFSMLLGFSYLLLLAILFYALCTWLPRAQVRVPSPSV